MRKFLLLLCVLGFGCGGCRSAPPFDANVFLTAEAEEEYGGAVCDPSIGIVAPLPVCSPEQSCQRPLPVLGGLRAISTATDVPECESGDTRRELTDRDGNTRLYCIFEPSVDEPMPLVVFLHGSGGNAENVYDNTYLRRKADDFDLGGPDPGFVLVSIQGRNLHWPTDDPRDGPHHDVFHRDLSVDSDNRDVALLDDVIDGLVDDGRVDPTRIYVTGWSNGMHFAQMYGIARHETATSGGNRVAAVTGFSAADPFHNRAHDQEPSCRLDPYPKSEVPILLISRSCDAVPCSDAQYDEAVADAGKTAPGTSQQGWMRTLEDRVENPNARRIIIDDDGEEVSACEPVADCGTGRALINHVRWPNGDGDRSGNDWEPTMLEFLRDNELPTNQP